MLALEPNSERIKGNFIKNVLVNALPPGILMSVTIAAFYLIAYFTNMNDLYGFTEDSLRTISTWYISIAALFVLIEVCLPVNKYRLFVLLIASILIFAIFIWSIFGVNWLVLEGEAPRVLSLNELSIFLVMISTTLSVLIIVWVIKHFIKVRRINREMGKI